jgi:hypothetical protein
MRAGLTTDELCQLQELVEKLGTARTRSGKQKI